jgi:hypothetical protein
MWSVSWLRICLTLYTPGYREAQSRDQSDTSLPEHPKSTKRTGPLSVSVALMVAGALLATPVFAQSPPKQKTDGDGLTQVGPGSGAYKQKTQSLSHTDPEPSPSRTDIKVLL